MTCDVFIRESGNRSEMLDLVISVWHRELMREAWTRDRRLPKIVYPPMGGIQDKRYAEENSRTPIYLVTDEDCLPIGDKFLERGLAVMERHPLYGILTATSVCDGHYPAGVALPAEEVVPLHAVGGVAFVRKGILTEFNPCRPDQVDDTICSEFTRKGWVCGVIPSLKFNHLGCGYSIPVR